MYVIGVQVKLDAQFPFEQIKENWTTPIVTGLIEWLYAGPFDPLAEMM